VGAGFVDASRFERYQAGRSLHAEPGNHLLLFFQLGIFKPARFQFRNALIQRSQEFTKIGEIPLVRSVTMRPLIAASDSRAPSNALNASRYHAKVLGLKFLEVFALRDKLGNSPLFAVLFSQVVEIMGA
jgi:hypothetical protein